MSIASLYISGKPQDFQTLLRLNRLPSFVRGFIAYLRANIFPYFNFKFDVGLENSEQAMEVGSMKVHPTLLPLEGNVTPSNKIAASAGLTAFISTKGKLYTLGINSFGQVRLDDDDAAARLYARAAEAPSP